MADRHRHYADEVLGALRPDHPHPDTDSRLKELESLAAGLREDLSSAELSLTSVSDYATHLDARIQALEAVLALPDPGKRAKGGT